MNQLVPINTDADRPTVLGRDLHAALEVQTAYKDWFPRMCEYGFTEGVDFNLLRIERVQQEGGRAVTREVSDHQLTLSMAKELCMLQRTEKGKQCRQYFIDLEAQWNSPEQIMARALQIADYKIKALQEANNSLLPKATYYDSVLNSDGLVSTTQIAKDFGKSAVWMNRELAAMGIQFRQRGQWFLYQRYAELGYAVSKTQLYPDADGNMHAKLHTYWTQKGRAFIVAELAKHNIFPLATEVAV